MAAARRSAKRAAARARGAAGRRVAGDELVVTPCGPRPARWVHAVPQGCVVDESGGTLRIVDPSGKRAAIRGKLTQRRVAAAATGSGGWVTWASWVNDTGTPFVSFTTRWVVPPAPATRARQVVFLFNALTDASSQHIVQPVLWWGSSEVGGGAFWSAASWHVTASGHAFHSQPVPVTEGQALTGVIEVDAAGGARCTCAFRELPQTRLVVDGLPALVMATETLEAYGVSDASEYPRTARTAMAEIEIRTGASPDRIPWSVRDGGSLGERTVVVSDDARRGEVHIYYGAAARGATRRTAGAKRASTARVTR